MKRYRYAPLALACTLIVSFAALSLSACSTQSMVAERYAGQSLSGGTLVVAPLQGETQIGDGVKKEALGDAPAETYRRFMSEALPSTIGECAAFDEVRFAEYDGEANFTTNVVEYTNMMSGKTRAYLDVPLPGGSADFESVDADYVLFVKDLRLLQGSRGRLPGSTANAADTGFRQTDLRQHAAFILWDNRQGEYVLNGGGTSRRLAHSPVANEETMQRAAANLTRVIFEDSPFENDCESGSSKWLGPMGTY